MKRWFTLLGGCLVAISMVMAADQPLKRLTSVQLAQMRLSDLTETSVQKSVLDRNTGGNLQSRLESQEPVVTQKAKLSALEGVAPIRMSGHNSAALQKVLKQSLSKKTTVASTWLDEGNYDISWYNTSQRNFVLTTPAQLAGLSQLVSLGYNFYFCTVRLGLISICRSLSGRLLGTLIFGLSESSMVVAIRFRECGSRIAKMPDCLAIQPLPRFAMRCFRPIVKSMDMYLVLWLERPIAAR